MKTVSNILIYLVGVIVLIGTVSYTVFEVVGFRTPSEVALAEEFAVVRYKFEQEMKKSGLQSRTED